MILMSTFQRQHPIMRRICRVGPASLAIFCVFIACQKSDSQSQAPKEAPVAPKEDQTAKADQGPAGYCHEFTLPTSGRVSSSCWPDSSACNKDRSRLKDVSTSECRAEAVLWCYGFINLSGANQKSCDASESLCEKSFLAGGFGNDAVACSKHDSWPASASIQGIAR
jgi:hypothetical protein